MTNDIETIGFEMIEQDLPKAFVLRVVRLARESEGAAEMLELWREASGDEREAIVAELHEMLEDREPAGPALVLDSALEAEAELEKRRELKGHLRSLIEERGGVTRVAAAAGIPQPSLSRLLNSMSEPRPSTLSKLADAMGLPLDALRATTAVDLAAARRERVRTEAGEALSRQLGWRGAA